MLDCAEISCPTDRPNPGGRPSDEDGPLDGDTVETIRIADLRVGESPRLSGMDPAHVRALTDCDAEFPPILVHRSSMRVIDGMHRVTAARLRGETVIAARFFTGTRADAFVLGVEQNVRHGLPLSCADRRAAATRIMASHPQWSDRRVAVATGLSAGSVGRLRRSASDTIEQLDVRVGRDGRSRPLNVADGRIRAGELFRTRPTAPLRAVATEAGISVNTARDVRNRLARGEDPVPAGVRRDDRSAAGEAAGSGWAGVEPHRESWSVLRANLERDPSLRLSEAGRTVLRLLRAVALSEHDRRRLLSSVPPHCRCLVAELARHCAEEWADAAARLSRED